MTAQPDDRSGGASRSQAAVRLTRIDDDQLEAHIPQLTALIRALQAELAMSVAEYDRRGLADRHLLSTRQWLKHQCRMTASRASRLLRLGRSLWDMASLRTRALEGDIPFEGVHAIAAVRERHRAAFEAHGEVLVDVAATLSPRDLRRAIGYWEQQAHPEVAAGDARERFARRRLSVNQTFDGMWAMTGDLDPESGHVVDTTIRAIADPGEIDDTDRRTPPQRRADALVEACRFWLDHNTTAITSSGVKPHITVTLDYDALVASGPTPHQDGRGIDAAPLPEIDGLPVLAEDIRRIACDADVVRIVTRGDSEVLDIGRATRTVPSGMRRALDHRDGGCTWVGCGAPAGWCDAHHIEHWADGGATALDNLRLLCRRHHRAMHEDGSAPPATRGRPPPDP